MWKSIPSCPGYEASEDGKIRSIHRTIMRSNGRLHTVPERVLSLGIDTQGYNNFRPWINKEHKSKLVHRAVFESYVRLLNPGEEIDQIDNNTINNHIYNLQDLIS